MLFQRAPGVDFLLTAIKSREDGMAPLLKFVRDTFVAYECLGFIDILRGNASSRAEDDRDHGYAFLGFAPFLLRHMTVDYTLSIEETFAMASKALIKETQSVDFLEALPLADRSKSKPNLPSWVPNWTLRPSHAPILCYDNLFNAAGLGFGLPQLDKCNHYRQQPLAWTEIELAGQVIDEVLHKLTPFSVYQVSEHIEINVSQSSVCFPWEMSTLDRFMDELIGLGVSNQRESWMRPLLRVLFMDGSQWASLAALSSGLPRYREGIRIEGVPHNEKMDNVISALIDSAEPDLEALPHGATTQILHELCTVQFGRRVVYSKSGRFAMAMDGVENGDKDCCHPRCKSSPRSPTAVGWKLHSGGPVLLRRGHVWRDVGAR